MQGWLRTVSSSSIVKHAWDRGGHCLYRLHTGFIVSAFVFACATADLAEGHAPQQHSHLGGGWLRESIVSRACMRTDIAPTYTHMAEPALLDPSIRLTHLLPVGSARTAPQLLGILKCNPLCVHGRVWWIETRKHCGARRRC